MKVIFGLIALSFQKRRPQHVINHMPRKQAGGPGPGQAETMPSLVTEMVQALLALGSKEISTNTLKHLIL